MTSQLSSPFSTGGGGNNFETKVQTVFLTLMACKGFIPTLPRSLISEIQYQGKYQGFNTDDLIVYAGKRKLLIQIKHSISITKGDATFKKVLEDAWEDFNNDKFNNGDKIALITKYLSQADIDDTLFILNLAKTSKDEENFYGKIKMAKFISEEKRDKLKVFEIQIKSIKPQATNKEIFEFLECFYLLGFESGSSDGISETLLKTLLSQYYDDGLTVFLYLQSKSRYNNEHAGTMTYEMIVAELDANFAKKKPIEIIPDKFIRNITWDSSDANIKELALANLIGSWNENNEQDKLIISNIIGGNYQKWIKKIRPFLHQENSPIKLQDGIWDVNEREFLWDSLAAHIHNDELDRLKDNALIVFKEKDPKFELESSERWMANVHNKVLTHSPNLRQGMAETIAIIGNNLDKLEHCDFDKRENFSASLIRELFNNIDWILWGSINTLLPTLAQANPSVFLEQVDSAITKTPELFIELFSEEDDPMFGGNEITGLLWALEALAWDEASFMQTCMILASLASIDPGGSTANRPVNSLSTILLPWLPRTNAVIDKRKKLVEAIVGKHPLVAWDLLLGLLPNQRQFSTSTYKPTWFKVDIDDENNNVSNKDYWNQCDFYVGLILSMAKNKIDELIILVKYVNHLTPGAFNTLLAQISSEEIIKLPETKRLSLYFSLDDLIVDHTKFQDAEWALFPKEIDKVRQISEKIKPLDIFNLHQGLFTGDYFGLHTEKENYQERVNLIADEQKGAVEEIFSQQGLDKIIEFSLTVNDSRLAGRFLGKIPDGDIDKKVLPKYLTSENFKGREFIAGYSSARYEEGGLDWLKSLDIDSWCMIEKANLLKDMPTKPEVWEQVSEWLGNQENLYWDEININPYFYSYSIDDFKLAVDKLLEYHRPNTAIGIINIMVDEKLPLDIEQSIKALLMADSSVKDAKHDPVDIYKIAKVVKFLQQSSDIQQDALIKIEWAYLERLNLTGAGIKPITLENKIATDPDFFCEVIQSIYRPSGDTVKKELTAQEQSRAMQSYRLLEGWKTIPGFTNGGFSQNDFEHWLDSVKSRCEESGHLKSALRSIGKVLIHTPKDKSGLWINRTVAQALNNEESEEMRIGFAAGIMNNRGVHRVDPTGEPEDELADKYLQQAHDLENEGFIRFARTLKDISRSYRHEAKRVRQFEKGIKYHDS